MGLSLQTGNNIIYIVGIGADGRGSLTEKALKVIRRAQILIGGSRILSYFRSLPAKKIHISSDIDKVFAVIGENRDKRTVILASGDPNHYGISKKILERFPKGEVEIIPNVSSMQLAFAAAKEPMDGAIITSVHGRGMEGLTETVRRNQKLGIYTDPENDPVRIASMLIKDGIRGYTAYICEDLGTKDERIFKSRLSGVTKRRFSPLNIMILIRDHDTSCPLNPDLNLPIPGYILGIPDEDFSHSGGMITKAEVRILALARLRFEGALTLWDIGAGSGSISIEAAGLIPSGRIFAVEKDQSQIAHLHENIRRFSRKNIVVCEGEAPDILDQLSDPDRVFIGGSGGRLKEILIKVISRLRRGGIVVINAVTTPTFIAVVQILKEHKFEVEIMSVNISKTRTLSDTEIFEPQTPTFIISGKKLEG